VWAGMPTAIIGDSLLRGQELKRTFAPWAKVYVHEDKEALTQKPPADCQRAFYVTAGNAMYKHRFMYMDNALKLMRTEEFLKKVGGVILLGSVELWDRLYAPTTFSKKTINPSFFDDMTTLCKELGVPLLQLDDDFINNIRYTSDAHIPSGQQRWDLADLLQKSLVELSQSGVDKDSVDEEWQKKFQNYCDKKPHEKRMDNSKDGGCKWCKKGDCWDHQVIVRKPIARVEEAEEDDEEEDEENDLATAWPAAAFPTAAVPAAARFAVPVAAHFTGMPNCKWCRKGECWDHQSWM